MLRECVGGSFRGTFLFRTPQERMNGLAPIGGGAGKEGTERKR
jgi:hypothetical protein